MERPAVIKLIESERVYTSTSTLYALYHPSPGLPDAFKFAPPNLCSCRVSCHNMHACPATLACIKAILDSHGNKENLHCTKSMVEAVSHAINESQRRCDHVCTSLFSLIFHLVLTQSLHCRLQQCPTPGNKRRGNYRGPAD